MGVDGGVVSVITQVNLSCVSSSVGMFVTVFCLIAPREIVCEQNPFPLSFFRLPRPREPTITQSYNEPWVKCAAVVLCGLQCAVSLSTVFL